MGSVALGISTIEKMATIQVHNFTFRPVVGRDTITVSTYGDGIPIRDDMYGTLNFTLDLAVKDSKFKAENFGVLGVGNMNFYKKVERPQPVPVLDSSYKSPELKQPRYQPPTLYTEPKSTLGGEFHSVETGEEYVGRYVEAHGSKFYAGSSPEENGIELKKVDVENVGLVPVMTKLQLALRGVFKKIVSKGDKDRGFTKRFFIQDKNTNKITETDQQNHLLAKKLTNQRVVEVDWIVKSPADDTKFGTYLYEGATSKNKKAIEALESKMPGVSFFIKDYSVLVENMGNIPLRRVSEVEIEKDSTTELTVFRKANFDKKE